MQRTSWRCHPGPLVRTAQYGPPFEPQHAIVRLRTVCVLLPGLAVTLAASGCGGAHQRREPRTRGSPLWHPTPPPLEAASTAIAMGTVTRLDPEIAASLTAEATR